MLWEKNRMKMLLEHPRCVLALSLAKSSSSKAVVVSALRMLRRWRSRYASFFSLKLSSFWRSLRRRLVTQNPRLLIEKKKHCCSLAETNPMRTFSCTTCRRPVKYSRKRIWNTKDIEYGVCWGTPSFLSILAKTATRCRRSAGLWGSGVGRCVEPAKRESSHPPR